VRKKGECRGDEVPSAGVWGAPSFSFSSLAATGGKESLKSSPVRVAMSYTEGVQILQQRKKRM